MSRKYISPVTRKYNVAENEVAMSGNRSAKVLNQNLIQDVDLAEPATDAGNALSREWDLDDDL